MGGGEKICLPHLGNMTKMTITLIYGKKLLKIFSGTKGPMALVWCAALGHGANKI